MLTVALPALPHGQARAALLEHLVDDVHRASADQAPEAGRLVQWNQCLHDERRKQAMSNAGGGLEARALEKLHAALWDTWSPWAQPLEHAWGWVALGEAIYAGQVSMARALLIHAHAPDASTLSHHKWMRHGKFQRAKTHLPLTLMGHILMAPTDQPGGPEARVGLVGLALGHGVDPNTPVNTRGELPGEHAVGRPMELLLDAGGRVGGQAARHIHAGTPLPVLHAKLSGWSEAIKRGKSPEVAADLALAWPQLLIGLSGALGRSIGSGNQHRHRDVIRQTRALGRLLGVDCLRPAAGELSLPGVWAHAAVTQNAFHKQGEVLEGLKRVVKPSILRSYHLPEGWGGQASDGLADGVWGLILMAACRMEKKEDVSILAKELPLMRGAMSVSAFWDQVVQAFEKLPVGPLAWRALSDLPRIASQEGALDQWSQACFGLLERTTQQLAALEIPVSQQLATGDLDSLLGVVLGNHRRVNNEALGNFLGEAAYALNRRPQTGTTGVEGRWTECVVALHLMSGFARGAQAQKVLDTASEQGWSIDRSFVLSCSQSPMAVMQLGKVATPQLKALLLDMQWSPPQGSASKPRF